MFCDRLCQEKLFDYNLINKNVSDILNKALKKFY